jgi:diguanylate cyclase (GGDEF)-like protein
MNESEDFQKGIENLIDQMIARLPEERQSVVRKQLAQQREVAWIARAQAVKAQEEQKRLEEAAKRAVDAAERQLLNLLVTAMSQQKEQLHEMGPNDVGKHLKLLLKILEGAEKREGVDEKELLKLLVTSMSQEQHPRQIDRDNVSAHVELLLTINARYTELEVAKAKCPKNDPADQIDIDYLTGLFSTRQLDKALIEEIARAEDHHTAGLLNTRYLNKVLIEEIARAEDYQTRLTMLMLDIDDLKLVNDTFGHLAGNGVFKSVADIVRSSVRPSDFVFRSGRDEFIFLLPGIGLDVGWHIGENIRDRIGASFFGLVGKITIAGCEYEAGEGEYRFMFRTEEALRSAKGEGDDGMSSVWVPVR